MALDSFWLFLLQVRSSPKITQDTRVQIVFDMLYEGGFLGQGCHWGTLSFQWRIMKLIQAYVFVFDASDERVLTTCMHTRQVLKSRVVAYLSSDTAEKQVLRQCLVYSFLTVW